MCSAGMRQLLIVPYVPWPLLDIGRRVFSPRDLRPRGFVTPLRSVGALVRSCFPHVTYQRPLRRIMLPFCCRIKPPLTTSSCALPTAPALLFAQSPCALQG